MQHINPETPYVFVSYASADRERVLSVARALESQGIAIWLDQRSITGGRRWTREVVHAIEGCAACLIMVSPAAVASRNVQQEIQIAWDSARRMLPVILVQTEMPAEVRYALAGQQWVEVLGRPDEDWLPQVIAFLRDSGLRGSEEAQTAQVPSSAADLARQSVAERRRHNIPAPRDSFIGRARHLEELSRILRDHRIVTITGAAGVGKSRLALEYAWRAIRDYPDGVWLVALDSVADPELIANLVAQAAAIPDVPAKPLRQQLIERLARQRALLILDNCERLLGSCAELVVSLLAPAGNLRVIATSREMLGIGGESIVVLEPLELPEPQSELDPKRLGEAESVQLFVDRARMVWPSFELTSRNAAAVAGICRALDGMPLAIELAAARLRVLTPEQIRSRLGRAFGLLKGTDSTALPRQRTLQAAVDWSYDVLTEPERTLWCRLSVFAERFELEAAEQICGFHPLEVSMILDLLTSLVDQSLVLTERGSDAVRYRMLKTLKQYAEGKLLDSGEAAQLRDRHAAWCLDVARTGNQVLLKREYANLRAALEHLLEAGRADEALDIAGTQGMVSTWLDAYPSDGLRTLEAVISHAEPAWSESRGWALFGLGFLRSAALRPQDAGEPLHEALDMARQEGAFEIEAHVLNALGLREHIMGDHDQAEAFYRQSLECARTHGSKYRASLTNLGSLYLQRGDIDLARPLFAEASRMYSSLLQLCAAYIGLALIALVEGDLEEAARIAALCLETAKSTGSYRTMLSSLNLYGGVLALSGNMADASMTLRRSLRMAYDEGEMWSMSEALLGLSFVASREGDTRRALTIWAAAEPVAFAMMHFFAEVTEKARAALPPSEFETCWAAGKAMSLEEKVAYALDQPGPDTR